MASKIRQSFVCYGPGPCEDNHEPPDPDCWKCAKVFWDWALATRIGDTTDETRQEPPREAHRDAGTRG